MRVKKPRRARISPRSKRPALVRESAPVTRSARRVAHAKKPARSARSVGVGTLAVVMVCMSAAAMLSAALRSGASSEDAATTVQTETVAATEDQPVEPVRPTTSMEAADELTEPAEPSAAASPPETASVTITGCLELDDDTFRLRNTTGVDAPKSRSWKTGFLKRSSASIDVVDASNSLKLPDHIGERVTVTGLLVDREMQVRSLERVASSCDQKA